MSLSNISDHADDVVETGPMTHARSNHCATRMADGRVVVTGGVNDLAALDTTQRSLRGTVNAVLDTAEIYLPDTHRWGMLAPMLSRRSGHCVAVLTSGDLLVVGGDNGIGSQRSVERYDTVTGQWTAVAPMATPRFSHSGVTLKDGKLLVCGGNNLQDEQGQVLSAAEIYNATNATWRPAAPMHHARMNHTATVLPSGMVLVVGGYPGASDQAATDSAELYDPSRDVWIDAAPLPYARMQHTATLLASGKVLIVGGALAPFEQGHASSQVYDPATNRWETAAELTYGRKGHTATVLPSGRVLVVGSASTASPVSARVTELYDPQTGQWTVGADLLQGRFAHAATALDTGEVLIVGGMLPVSHPFPINTAELYRE
ncbi:Kelch repeat-containing protein [Pandoraea aquatica]|nr:kelch repeat-containing protein [Pandoraea aquatica]